MRNHPWLEEAIEVPGADAALATAAVRGRAAALIDLVRRDDADWCPPPFEPRRYADALGIPVHMDRTMTNWDALLLPLPDGHRIICNANVRHPGRVAFSIAHEIAHLFFAGAAEQHYHLRSRQEHDYETAEALRLERLCDLGAAELLMPAEAWAADVERLGFRAAAIPELAERYGVSFEAAALRLVQARGGFVAAGFFEFAARPGRRNEPEHPGRTVTYRARRVFRGPGFPFLFPEGKSVAEASVVYRASLGRKERRAEEEFALGAHRERLLVSAFPLHRTPVVEEPPVVVAVFSRSGDLDRA